MYLKSPKNKVVPTIMPLPIISAVVKLWWNRYMSKKKAMATCIFDITDILAALSSWKARLCNMCPTKEKRDVASIKQMLGKSQTVGCLISYLSVLTCS